MPTPPSQDWTPGPAKWLAVAVLGIAAIAMGVWGWRTRTPGSELRRLGADVTGPPAMASEVDRPADDRVGGLDLNTASAAQLDLLPGIGPALAQRIIDDRAEHGPYVSLEQLRRVKGIGPKTLEKLRPHVRVGPSASPAPGTPTLPASPIVAPPTEQDRAAE